MPGGVASTSKLYLTRIVDSDTLSSYNVLDVSSFKHDRINHSKLFSVQKNHIDGIELLEPGQAPHAPLQPRPEGSLSPKPRTVGVPLAALDLLELRERGSAVREPGDGGATSALIANDPTLWSRRFQKLRKLYENDAVPILCL